MTEKPKVDYFIVDGKVINRGDDGFAELEAKYVKELHIGVKEEYNNNSNSEKSKIAKEENK